MTDRLSAVSKLLDELRPDEQVEILRLLVDRLGFTGEELATFAEKPISLEGRSPARWEMPGFGYAASAYGMAPMGLYDQPYEPFEFRVTLTSPAKTNGTVNGKIQTILVIRQTTGLGLVEAKLLLDHCPSVLMEGVSKATAEEVAEKFRAIGATVEIVGIR
jgi:large subunit ribosomal protein L7/L12